MRRALWVSGKGHFQAEATARARVLEGEHAPHGGRPAKAAELSKGRP